MSFITHTINCLPANRPLITLVATPGFSNGGGGNIIYFLKSAIIFEAMKLRDLFALLFQPLAHGEFQQKLMITLELWFQSIQPNQ